MNCERFDPITGSVAICCAVCSQNDECVTAMYSKLEQENKKACDTYISELLAEQKKAALVQAHQDGKAEQNNTRSASSIYEN